MSNVKLTIEAEARHIFEVDGKTYNGGDEISVTPERAAELIAAGFPLGNLDALTRDVLDNLAKARGVDTADLSTKAEVVEALSSAPDHTPSGGSEPIHANLDEGRQEQEAVPFVESERAHDTDIITESEEDH